MGLEKSDILFVGCQHPQDEIRVETARLEKAYALTSAHVPQKKKLNVVLLQNGVLLLTPGLQVNYKLVLAFVQNHRLDDYFTPFSDMKKRLEQVPAEAART